MIASRRTVQGLCRIVLPHDLLQKVCSFSADHALEREKEKWKPIFRSHPALNFWNRLRSSFWMDSIQNHERNLKAPKAKMAAFHLRVRGSHPIKSSQE
jgi:hypothetical protein